MSEQQRAAQLRRGTSADVIARHIRTDIESGKLSHQEQLRPTVELAAEWGVSTATISRALAKLVDEGIVISKARAARVVNYPATDTQLARNIRPRAIVIGGYAGSGKTELGRILARRTRWPILDKDTLTRPVVEAALEKLGTSPHDRESETYLTVVRPGEYMALNAAMAENLRCGVSVIVTAPFIREMGDRAWCDRLRADVESMGAALHVVWVRADVDSMHHYLRHRGAARDATKLADWDKYVSGINTSFTPAIDHTIIDNSVGARPLQEQANELVKEIA